MVRQDGRYGLKATDSQGLHAVLFFDPQADCVIGGAELKGTRQVGTLKLPVKAELPERYTLMALVADGGGNITSATREVVGKR